MKRVFALTILVSALGLGGCLANKTVKTETAVSNTQNQALSEINNIRLPSSKNHVFVENRAWTPTTSVAIKKEDVWEPGNKHVSFHSSTEGFNSFAEFAGRISSLTKVSIELTPEVLEMASQLPSGDAVTSSTMTDINETSTSAFNVDYSGPLSGLLDAVTAQHGFYWKPKSDGGVLVYKTTSKTWRITALLGNLTQVNKVDSGGSNSAINVTALSIWTAFEDAVKSQISQDGKVVVSEALGTISVTDTPLVLEKIGRFIKQQNDSLRKNVLVNLKIYRVQLEDTEDYAIDWSLVYKSLNATAPGVSASLLNSTLAPNASSNLSLGIVGGNSEFNASNLLMKALSVRGKVSQITDTNQLTLNGRPAPFKFGKKKAYLKSSQTTISNGVASTSSEQGVVESGFFLNVVPHVLDDNQDLLLQIALNISTLDGMTSVTSGTSTIQTPETSSREMIQRVRLRSGDTLVMTGFDSTDLRSALGGVGSAENSLFGGSASANDSRSILVILVQPVVGDSK